MNKIKKIIIGLVAIPTAFASVGVVANNQINPYTDRGGVFEISKDRGNEGTTRASFEKSRAKITLGKWNDEVQMGVEYKKVKGVGKRKVLTKNIEWQGVNELVRAYPLSATTTMEGGGYEFEIELARKPASNVFDFEITGAENLDFFYQPALTAQEITDGAYRPDNVIGSYAVYHKTNKNYKVGSTNYATGKAYHIYRPKAIDANGVEVWAILSYSNGILSVTVPQYFLDNAVYPVIVDPTFGNTTIGGSTRIVLAGNLNGTVFTTPTDIDSVSKLTLYAKHQSSSSNIKGVIVLDSNLTIITNGITDPISINTTASWNDYTFSTSPTLTSSTNYVLMAIPETSNVDFYYDASATQRRDNSNNYSSPTDPTDAVTFADNYSIYATYTATGGATPTATSTVQMNNGSIKINNGKMIIQ